MTSQCRRHACGNDCRFGNGTILNVLFAFAEWSDGARSFPLAIAGFTSGAGIIKSRRGSRCAVSRGLETTSANMASMDKRRHQPASIACGLPPCFACPLRALLPRLGPQARLRSFFVGAVRPAVVSAARAKPKVWGASNEYDIRINLRRIERRVCSHYSVIAD
jgi:hypothetical protein